MKSAWAIAAALAWASGAAAQEAGVVVARDVLPARGAAYEGSEPHLFFDGHVALPCGSHGLFSSAVEPPRRVGASVVADYTATFLGEVSLEPPVVATAVTHALAVQAHMVERITLASARGGTRVFDAEMTTLDLAGPDMPPGILARESPTKASSGRYVITGIRHGYRIESFFDVWLEISLDGGRSWHPAQAPVRMWLEPQPAAPRAGVTAGR